MKKIALYTCFGLLCVLPAGCGFFDGLFGPPQVLFQKQALSRDFTYLEFARERTPFKIETEVGGEHIKTIKIIGFEGNKFLVEFTGISGNLSYHIKGEGTEFVEISPYSGTIMIRDMEAIAGIETYAHPYAAYTLIITPL